MIQDSEDYSRLKTPPGRGGDPKGRARYHARKNAGEYYDPFMFYGSDSDWLLEDQESGPESLTVEDALCLCGCVEGLPDLCENITTTGKLAYNEFVHQSQQRARRRVEDAEFDALPGPTPETVDQSQVDRSSAWKRPETEAEPVQEFEDVGEVFEVPPEQKLEGAPVFVQAWKCDFCDFANVWASKVYHHELECEHRPKDD